MTKGDIFFQGFRAKLHISNVKAVESLIILAVSNNDTSYSNLLKTWYITYLFSKYATFYAVATRNNNYVGIPGYRMEWADDGLWVVHIGGTATQCRTF